MNELVGKETIYLAAGYLAVLLLLYNYFTKRNLLRCIIEGFINVSGKVKGEVSAELGGSKIKKIYDKHKFMCDLLTYFCACVFIAWITLENTLALVQDIVLFRNHECEVLVGTVETTSDDNSDSMQERIIFMKEHGQGETIRVRLYTTALQEGEVIRIIYLPNTQIAELIEKLE